MNKLAPWSRQPSNHLRCREDLVKYKTKATRASFVLSFIGTATYTADQLRLVIPVERASGRHVAKAVDHDATDDHALNPGRLQDLS